MSLLDDLEDDLASKRRGRQRTRLPNQTSYFCTKCGEHLAASSFAKNRASPTGLQVWCRNCSKVEHTSDYTAVIRWNHQARKLKLQGRISEEQWLALQTRYRGRCGYCGLPAVQLSPDHFYPLSWARQGHERSNLVTGWITNCVPACYMCNRAKSDMDPIQFINWLQAVKRGSYEPTGTYNQGEVYQGTLPAEPPRPEELRQHRQEDSQVAQEDDVHQGPAGEQGHSAWSAAELEWLRAEA